MGCCPVERGSFGMASIANEVMTRYFHEEFALHVRAAVSATDASRLPPDDIKEPILMAAIYCGVPAENHAFSMAGEILKEQGLVTSFGSD